MPQSMQANLYDQKNCQEDPVISIQASPLALQATGNAHLLRIPDQFLPQCSDLLVNNQPTNYQISIQSRPQSLQAETPYLELSTYLEETCGVETDLKLSLIADESVHQIGVLSPEQVRQLESMLNPDMVQTQMIDEDQSPISIFYKANCEGNIELHRSAAGDETSLIMDFSVQQFMNTCFSPSSPFPGFRGSNANTIRSETSELKQLQSILLQGVQKRSKLPPQEQIQVLRREMLDGKVPHRKSHDHIARDILHDQSEHVPSVEPTVEHLTRFVHRLSDHLETRSNHGLPVSFQITCSTSAKLAPILSSEETSWPEAQPPVHHPRPKPHHGSCIGKYLGPREQTFALFFLGMLTALMIVKMMKSRSAARARAIDPEMQQSPVDQKRNRDYAAVPTVDSANSRV